MSDPLHRGQEQDREQAFQQLQTKLERGAAQAARGELLDGDQVFAELRKLIGQRNRAQSARKKKAV